MNRMYWERLLSAHRFGEPQTPSLLDTGRTPFHKDYDKIIFSSAFHRLGRKTQVHPLTDNDHLHNRLTHSLEVASVGRSLGNLAGQALADKLPGSMAATDIGAIVQAACLAHDIGNPPYGHSGEEAIRHWFQDTRHAALLEGLSDQQRTDLQTFEGNAQGFRLVTQVEYNRFQGGMRFTYATLGAFLKYPWTADQVTQQRAKKFGCYQSELPILRDVAEHLGLIQTGSDRWVRHPLVYLVEAADDICYGLVDLEDGVEIGLLTYDEVEALLAPLLAQQWHQIETELILEDSPRRKLQILRGYAMEVMVREVSNAFVHHETELLSGTLTGDMIDYCSPTVSQTIKQAKALARQRIFKDGRKLSIEIGAYSTLSILLEAFLNAARESTIHGQPTFRNARLLELMGSSAPQPDWDLYAAYMRVMDFIAGMTDNYAATLAQQFSGYQPG